MKPVFFSESATLFFKIGHYYSSIFKSKCINKHKQRPLTRGTDHVLSPFTKKSGVLYTALGKRVVFGGR